MRVVHVATAFPRHEEDVITPWLGELLLAQRAAGIDVEVLAPAYRGGGASRWRGVPIHRFRYAPRRFETLTHDQTVPDRLRDRPLSAGLLPLYMLGGTAAARRIGGTGPDVMHVHWPVPHAWFGAVARAVSPGLTALVCSFYSVELAWIERRLPTLVPALRWSIETADGVTAISSSTARAVARYTERPVPVIPFAAATGGGDGGERLHRSPGPFEILFVGRLVERKGVPVLVRALARLRERLDARLTIVGEGAEAARIREAAATNGVSEHVRLLGRVDEEGLAEAYRSAHAFALPAIVDSKGDTEGLGVVLLEALEAGVPIVASGVGGIPDIVRDGDTGWLVPPGDAEALAAALARMAEDPAEAGRRVERGRALIADAFSYPAIVRAMNACYEGARARRGGRSVGGETG